MLFYFRAVDMHVLIGTIGGYVRLLLGFSLLQAPDLLMQMFNTLKHFHTKITNSSSVKNGVRTQTSLPLSSESMIFTRPNKGPAASFSDLSTISRRLEQLENQLRELTKGNAVKDI